MSPFVTKYVWFSKNDTFSLLMHLLFWSPFEIMLDIHDSYSCLFIVIWIYLCRPLLAKSAHNSGLAKKRLLYYIEQRIAIERAAQHEAAGNIIPLLRQPMNR
jgi:hypothetical protein